MLSRPAGNLYLYCHRYHRDGTNRFTPPKKLRVISRTAAAALGLFMSRELFWIAEHGVRYSGMFVMKGAFRKDASGRDPSDEKIWTMVTFLTHLDALPPAIDAEWRKSATQ